MASDLFFIIALQKHSNNNSDAIISGHLLNVKDCSTHLMAQWFPRGPWSEAHCVQTWLSAPTSSVFSHKLFPHPWNGRTGGRRCLSYSPLCRVISFCTKVHEQYVPRADGKASFYGYLMSLSQYPFLLRTIVLPILQVTLVASFNCQGFIVNNRAAN